MDDNTIRYCSEYLSASVTRIAPIRRKLFAEPANRTLTIEEMYALREELLQQWAAIEMLAKAVAEQNEPKKRKFFPWK